MLRGHLATAAVPRWPAATDRRTGPHLDLEQKDRWWFTSVYRGDMAQLTLRSAVTGFLLGGLLSATNLYVGAKTGWTLGVGLTSVILAFALYRASEPARAT
ncbi:MAG: OPT/YSL family transporter [Proteobacteria bacterium]|nr:OPT/YSL family transporter [Pseudomonadota bacterium]